VTLLVSGVRLVPSTVSGLTVAELLSLIPVLAVAYGVIMGAVTLVTGWRLFSGRRPRRYRRGAVVPPVGGTEQDTEGAR
jgi:hypothetical protein